MLANYQDERALLRSLYAPQCAVPIVALRGTSGSGKTTLLHHCLKEDRPAHATVVPVNLRPADQSVNEIFLRLGEAIEWQGLPAFTRQLNQLSGGGDVAVDRNWLAGIGNRISIVLERPDENERRNHRSALTKALCDDIKQQSHPLLLAFDHFEMAVAETRNWIESVLLPRVPATPPLRVIVAGQIFPLGVEDIEWGHKCARRDLYGVADARHWLPVVEAEGRRKPDGVENLEDWLAGICHAFQGNPAQIINVINGLPRRTGGQA